MVIMTKEELWESVLAQLQFKVSKANFATWLKNTRITQMTNGEVYVAVPNTFSREWLSKKYHHSIFEVLREVDPQIKSIKYIIQKGSGFWKEIIQAKHPTIFSSFLKKRAVGF